MLRLFTLILAACYVVSIIVAVVQELHERHKARAADNAHTSDR